MTGAFARATRRIRHDRLMGRVPGSERGSVALGIAIVAMTTRIHHYGTSNSGKSSWAGLIVAVVAIVVIFSFRWFRRNRRT
jgi:hypothetical protein